jgi:hypothetical protein
MIKSIAELLQAFIKKEVEYLDSQKIKHAPTIGKMYEGLAQDLLTKGIPAEWGLKVAEGFITNKRGEISNQIDCMLVIGDGEIIPYTNNYKYDIDNVIAVLEIKKNLYSSELSDAYKNLNSVYCVLQPKEVNANLFRDAYVSILGEEPQSRVELKSFPPWKSEIYRFLLLEELLPVRIALGYHGFASESSFRESFITYLKSHTRENGFGPNSLPNLIICDTFSIVKLNGMPYSTPINDENNYYHVLTSYSGNPLLLLLELIWTKITYHFNFMIPGFSDSLNIENLKPLLKAKAIDQNGAVGWLYNAFDLSKEKLSSVPLFDSWEPIQISNLQAVILQELINEGEMSTNGDRFLSLVEDPEYSEATLSELISSRLISNSNGKLNILTHDCTIVAMPDGSLIAGENNSGRLMKWIENYMKGRF